MNQATEPQLPQRWSPSHPRHVLLAEDDPDMRALMAWALREEGYEVQEVGDGREAIEVLGAIDAGASAPDLIVTDVQMPGASGFEVLEAVRRSRLGGVRVLVVTARGDWETHARAERLGAEVLDKPFDLDDLRKRVFDALEL